ncbi:hypothetical protein HPB50_024773 [Hyalomma asiaticum]|uniref:Uncharacterized protein n=1 Tax=Hyalomma asiaticum TaxID=266040 RepID=A0ACB7TBG1_HYAAI|nr:hypothetical protein HPB50_024773 [Hyalomma asiaticum]
MTKLEITLPRLGSGTRKTNVDRVLSVGDDVHRAAGKTDRVYLMGDLGKHAQARSSAVSGEASFKAVTVPRGLRRALLRMLFEPGASTENEKRPTRLNGRRG